MFCPQCGKEVADDQLFCHHCGAKLGGGETPHLEEALDLEQGPGVEETPAHEPGIEPGGRERTAWEDRETRGFFSGLFRTMNDSLFRPSEFFRKMPVTGGLTDPLLYALIVGMVGTMFSYFWPLLTQGAMHNMMPGIQMGAGQDMFQGIGLALLAFFSPFLIIIGLFVSAGILHVCLMLVKGTKTGYETTFRVVSYSHSAYLFLVIPFCGSLFMAIWTLVLYIIGLREAHETTGGKAVFAVFLPLIVCCGLALLALAMFLGAAAGSLGMMMQQVQQ